MGFKLNFYEYLVTEFLTRIKQVLIFMDYSEQYSRFSGFSSLPHVFHTVIFKKTSTRFLSLVHFSSNFTINISKIIL